jgi:hypothetical protein
MTTRQVPWRLHINICTHSLFPHSKGSHCGIPYRFFYPEDEGGRLLRNVGTCLPNCTVSRLASRGHSVQIYFSFGFLPNPYLRSIERNLGPVPIVLPSLGTGSDGNKANLNSVVRAIRHVVTLSHLNRFIVSCCAQISGPLGSPVAARALLMVIPGAVTQTALQPDGLRFEVLPGFSQ